MSELKPCPFCGAREDDEDEPLHVWWVDKPDGEYMVECDRCGASISWANNWLHSEAVEAWNRRATNE